MASGDTTPLPAGWHGPRVAAALWWAAPVGAALVVAAFAGGMGPIALAVVGGGALLVGTLADARLALLSLVAVAAFVDYAGGNLTRQLSVVSAWALWVGVVLLWRGAWVRFLWPSRRILWTAGIWLAWTCFGAVFGLAKGNNLRHLGLEFLGGCWPLVALAAMQVFGSRNLGYAAAGLALVALAHAPFGLLELWKVGVRIGGVYFIALTGIAAVGLWCVALLAPRTRLRWAALVAMVPLMLHLLLSFTRSFWMGFLTGMVAATLLAWRALGRWEPRARWARMAMLPGLASVLLASGLSAVAFYGGTGILESFGRRFGSSFSTEANWETASTFFRLIEYAEAVDAARRSPVIGQGYGQMITMRDPFFGFRKQEGAVHNYYLFLWLKLGAIGLLALGLLVYGTMRTAWEVAGRAPDWRIRAWAVATMAVTAQVLVISIANFPLVDVNTGFYLAVVWGTLWSLDRETAEARA